MAYKPTKRDVAWIKNLVAKLNLNGIWGYEDKPIRFTKIAEKTMALTSAPFGDAEIDNQIEMNKAVMAKAGITFVDRRGDIDIPGHSVIDPTPGTNKTPGEGDPS